MKRIHIDVSDDLYSAFRVACFQARRTMVDVLRECMERFSQSTDTIAPQNRNAYEEMAEKFEQDPGQFCEGEEKE